MNIQLGERILWTLIILQLLFQQHPQENYSPDSKAHRYFDSSHEMGLRATSLSYNSLSVTFLFVAYQLLLN